MDRETEYIANAVLTKVHRACSDFVNHLLDGSIRLGDSSASRFSSIYKLEIMLHAEKQVFVALYEIKLFTRKFRMLHHIVEILQRFGDVEYFDASPFEFFNFSSSNIWKSILCEKVAHFKNQFRR